MSLLVGETSAAWGNPTLSTYGLRVAGRLAGGDSGLVVSTPPTPHWRVALAADDVEESGASASRTTFRHRPRGVLRLAMPMRVVR